MTLTFLTPALPSDLDALARPATYLTWEIRSADGRPHAVQIYFDCGTELAVNTPDQKVVCDRPNVAGLERAQARLEGPARAGQEGDDLRIDWGYVYLAAARTVTKWWPPTVQWPGKSSHAAEAQRPTPWSSPPGQ